MTINRNDKSTFISTQMDSLIPQSKISTLTQDVFVGSVSDNFDERIEQKIFHCEIVVDNAPVAAETKAYQKIPSIMDFTTPEDSDIMQQQIQASYDRIKQEVRQMADAEIERIKQNPKLQNLIKS